MKHLYFAAASLIAVAVPNVAAAEDYAADQENIIVTATRHEAPLDSISASVTVLDKSAIDRAQDIGVSEILLRTPSISMARNGGYGTSTSLRIRGAESDHTVVVLDGVKLNDPAATGGGYNLAHLMIGDATQIEILRGPQSILWGSQAIGGVVNISSALPQSPWEGSFDIEMGSRDTVNARAAVGGKNGPLRWRIGVQNFTTDGISAIAPEFGGREKDGYRNRSVRGLGELTLSDQVQLDFGGYYGAGRVEIDSTSGDTPEYSLNDEAIAHAGLRFGLADGRIKNRITVQYGQTSRENKNPARARQLSWESEGSNKRAEYQGQVTIHHKAMLIVGADYEKSAFRSRSPSASLSTPLPAFARGEAKILGFYGQLLVKPVKGLHLDAGVRHDDHNSFGGATLFSAGGRWNLPSGTSIRASYGEGFKAPSLYQLYSEYGNLSLNPERSHGWEAGVEQKFFGSALTLSALYFERVSKQQIAYNGCNGEDDADKANPLCYVPGDSSTMRWGYYANVERSETKGVEASAALSLGALSLDANYSRVSAEDRSPDPSEFGNWLPRRPRETANVAADYRFDMGLAVGAAIRFAGKSYDNAANTRELAGYELVDLRVDMPLSPKFSVFARAENIFDTDYMTTYRYGTLGRSLYAGLRGRF